VFLEGYGRQNHSRLRAKMNRPEIIGLVPAGGKAARLAPLPCSKELYPVGFRPVGESGALRPKVVCHYLLERMRLANISKAYIILREGKWDIPAYFKDGKILDMHLAYLMMDLPFGVPYTLDQAYPFIRDAIVVFGFPDNIFQPDDAFVHLLTRQSESCADIVLGLFPTHQPHKVDMVDLDPDGQICGIHIKPEKTNLRYTWLIAVWTPEFTRFMHEYVATLQKRKNTRNEGANVEEDQELFVGNVIQAAIHKDIQIDTVVFPNGEYLDIGSPEDIVKAIQNKI
jgi:glucose-1-phosphate thymidylyltransferase